MTKTRTLLPVLLGALLAGLLSLTGCVSMPTGGPVQSYPVTQGTNAQSQQFMQIKPQGPGAGWNPQQIVQGFLTASAAFGSYDAVALQYLTPTEQSSWKTNTGWSALVYQAGGPNVSSATYQPNRQKAKTASVSVSGKVVAELTGRGNYSVNVPSQGAGPEAFQLQLVGGQWRISDAPLDLLLTTNSFQADYQLANLYFFDPGFAHLVPDPVYVPLEAFQQNLVSGLASELIKQPGDWLQSEGATRTAFPAGTTSSVTISGATAVVNLKGATITKASTATLQEVWAQLWSTLVGAGPGEANGQQVKKVAIELNGKLWLPSSSTGGNPVNSPPSKYLPPTGASKSGGFYYVDAAGNLTGANAGTGAARKLGKIGTGYTQLAVSPDGAYAAALRGGALYTGSVDGPLTGQSGAGYTAISWDSSDDLWASTSAQIVVFHGGAGQPVNVTAPDPNPNLSTPGYTALKVAPDGVRVAIVQNDDTLTFGAISGARGANPQITLSTVQDQLTVSDQQFQGLAWYGPDDVITLASGPAVTEYPVSGGTAISLPAESGLRSIAASYQLPTVGGVAAPGAHGDQLASAANNSALWLPITDSNDAVVEGTTPVYPG